ncbi:Gfo/Idh/MocA family protein [Kineococcus sp. SYSU DK003]|uniref:Gfo/Idh/MocA family protein n=1 Tax=Kineococcus sp. SYSU DK003 TaxID=3383124 RepID=UPI003D7EEEFD
MSSPSSSAPAPLGVGFLGAGPVTQAIHLPTLARLRETFTVRHVMDVDPTVAGRVAARVGARATSDVDELLADPEVDVVAVCSPHAFHADQVVAACRAGKKAVLCEKPFATDADQARRIAEVAGATRVPVLVGTMHAYDAGWNAALQNSDVVPHTVRSSIVLPPNPRFEDFATEVLNRPEFSGAPDAAAAVTGGILGLAVHDLPLVRQLLARAGADVWRSLEVVSAEPLAPFGYLVVARAGDITLELHAVMHGGWNPQWQLTAVGDDDLLEVEFTPSYVHAGSATATTAHAGTRTTHAPADHNGYEGEWRHLAAVVRGATPRFGLAHLIDDLEFVLEFARQSADAVRKDAA